MWPFGYTEEVFHLSSRRVVQPLGDQQWIFGSLWEAKMLFARRSGVLGHLLYSDITAFFKGEALSCDGIERTARLLSKQNLTFLPRLNDQTWWIIQNFMLVSYYISHIIEAIYDPNVDDQLQVKLFVVPATWISGHTFVRDFTAFQCGHDFLLQHFSSLSFDIKSHFLKIPCILKLHRSTVFAPVTSADG